MVVTVEILASLAEVVELFDINKNSQRTNKERNTKQRISVCLLPPSFSLQVGPISSSMLPTHIQPHSQSVRHDPTCGSADLVGLCLWWQH